MNIRNFSALRPLSSYIIAPLHIWETLGTLSSKSLDHICPQGVVDFLRKTSEDIIIAEVMHMGSWKKSSEIEHLPNMYTVLRQKYPRFEYKEKLGISKNSNFSCTL